MTQTVTLAVAFDERIWIFDARQLAAIVSIAEVNGTAATVDLEYPLVNDDGSLMATQGIRRIEIELGEEGGLSVSLSSEDNDDSRDIEAYIVDLNGGNLTVDFRIPEGWKIVREEELPEPNLL